MKLWEQIDLEAKWQLGSGWIYMTFEYVRQNTGSIYTWRCLSVLTMLEKDWAEVIVNRIKPGIKGWLLYNAGYFINIGNWCLFNKAVELLRSRSEIFESYKFGNHLEATGNLRHWVKEFIIALWFQVILDFTLRDRFAPGFTDEGSPAIVLYTGVYI